jgi:hypothetical protein
MKKIYNLIAFSIFASAFGQISIGNAFPFDVKAERDVKFVMPDSKTLYLQSAVYTDYPQDRKFYVRKFDNSNGSIIQEYNQSYPGSDDRAAIYEYIGSFSSSQKVTFLNESRLGKAKKTDVYKTVFDKETSKFTSVLLGSYPFESMIKSGNTYIANSDNGKYAGVLYHSYDGRKAEKKLYLNILDTNSAEVVWSKDITLTDDSSMRYFAVSNSGNAIITRDPSDYKGSSKVIIISKEDQQEKTFEGDLIMYQPYLFSMGDKDYLFAFDAPNRSSKDYYTNLLFYDLSEGQVISNNTVNDYANVKKPDAVLLRKIYYQNNQFQIFTESKYSVGTTKTGMFPEPIYTYGKSLALALDEAGKLVHRTSIGATPYASGIDNYRSYGVLNIQGNYSINDEGGRVINELNSSDFKQTAKFVKNTDDKSLNFQIRLPHVLSYDNSTKTYYFLEIKDREAYIVKASGYMKPEKK